MIRRPERYLLDTYDKASTESVMQSPWDTNTRQALVQRVMDSVNQASTTLLEGPLCKMKLTLFSETHHH